MYPAFVYGSPAQCKEETSCICLTLCRKILTYQNLKILSNFLGYRSFNCPFGIFYIFINHEMHC